MSRQPVWLRRERAYRAYIRGLRCILVGFGLGLVAGLMGAIGVIPPPAAGGFIIASFAVTIPSVLIGSIGWILVPDKNRANLHQAAFLAMIGHDIFKGMPKD